MELGLQMETLTCYETVGGVCVQHEETLETSIPEYCPDMARIVDAIGQLCIREKTVSEARLTVSGDVKVTVLYTSEEVAGLRTLNVTVPFTCSMEDGRLSKAEVTWVYGRVLLTEGRAVTSRKLYLRVLPELCAVSYVKAEKNLCISTAPEESLRVKKETVMLPLLTGVSEYEISLMQDIPPEGEITPEDLLTYRFCPKIAGVQHVGNKLVVKGDLKISALYRSDDQNLHTYDTSLPFSEVVEGLNLPENAECAVESRSCGGEMRALRTDSGGGFSVSVRIPLLICAYEERTVSYISDLYSTRYHSEVKSDEVTVPEARSAKCLHREAETRLEFGQRQPFVYLLSLECGQVSLSQEEGTNQIHTAWHAKLLYLDESGAPVTTERSEEITAETEKISGGVRAYCAEAETAFSGDSCQLRFPVTFVLREEDTAQLTAVTALTLEPREKERGPSLILRRMRSGETLWDIAKEYRTDEELIREINQLEGSDANDQMLLIPKIR